MDTSPKPVPPDETEPEICRRCGALLTAGKGNFYVVRIEAFAENSDTVISSEDMSKDHRHEMEKLIAELAKYSGQEIMDMVHRHMTFYLCTSCYKQWIENPVG
jgi:hypothetical protein